MKINLLIYLLVYPNFVQYTWVCASLAAGSLKHLADLVVEGKLANGLALVRPPGHHAMKSEACGYCIFNNVAITVASFLDFPLNCTPMNEECNVTCGGENSESPSQSTSVQVPNEAEHQPSIKKSPIRLNRILILDWDVHHGQGTQYAFYDDNR